MGQGLRRPRRPSQPDLGLLIAAWGACSGCPADIIGDGGGTRLFTGLDQSNGAGLVAWGVEETPTDPCSAVDLDGNGQVGSSDLGLLIAAWGTCSGCPADINGDGKVDGGDLAQIIAFWGPC